MEIEEISNIFEDTAAENAEIPKSTDAPKSEKKHKKKSSEPVAKVNEYKPVQIGRNQRSGCLGGIMYFVFIVCISVVLACLAWMAASDALALNNNNLNVTVTLPSSIFSSENIEVFDEDGNPQGTQTVTYADVDYVSSELKEAGLIQYPWLFKFFCRISNASRKLEPGEYQLKSSYDYRALVQHMQTGTGKALTVTITIPEGYTIYQTFRKLEENGVCSYDDLMEAAANYKYNYSFLEDSDSGDPHRLEGYLFPDTYEFYVDMQASSAINKFLKRYYDVLTADMQKQAAALGLSMREVMIVASMIEKEAAVLPEVEYDDRATISSVIYNRIGYGMSLGIDATILYVHPEWEGAPNAEMLEEDSPYNTRLYTGFTPTPICSPGLAAINAALHPEDTPYYYYALDMQTGTHRFFSSYYDHKNFVATQNYG